MPARKLTTDIGSLQAHSNGSRPVKHRHIVSGFESIEHHYQALVKALVASGGVANAGTVTLSSGTLQVQNRWGINLEGTLALWVENESLSLGTLTTGVKYRVVIAPSPVEETLTFSYQPPGASAETLTHVLKLRLGKLTLLTGDASNYPAIPADSLPVCKLTGPGTLDEVENPGLTLRGGSSYTDEQVRDVIGAALVAGTGISISVNDPADTITISATGGSGGSGGSGIWDAIYAALDANSDPVDALVTSGDTLAFVFLGSHNQNNWKSPVGAKYTVPAGKKLLVVQALGVRPMSDFAARQARLQNVTDGTTVVADDKFRGDDAMQILWDGDNTTPSRLSEVAAGKTVELQLWNADANKRAMGGIVICRLVNA